ncbi:hypothetical protein NF867_16650 [Solitalea sp. MAHUQ-68]|uniref:2'-5' RNA ligase n=1 Tax=Solitalea agri TaxID=2953739 RepID=A0A9X2F481_9SPHI|nr:hypothetical protein [Solitalea agri]MCO4294494.1 hypothetical protein [Solitalea agri]
MKRSLYLVFTMLVFTAWLQPSKASIEMSAMNTQLVNQTIRKMLTMDSSIIAINVLLKPDKKLFDLAVQTNARLLKDYPKGFPLDRSHVPHITLIQLYITANDLNKVIEVVSNEVKSANVFNLKLKVKGFKSSKWDDVGVTVLEIDDNLALSLFEQKLVTSLEPFIIKGGGNKAFIANDDGTAVGTRIIKYVDEFVPLHSGDKYSPHLTVGVASMEFLTNLEKEEYASFSFSPSAVAIYQLGDFGTARKELWSWSLDK